jgi:hypothetical protein
MNQNNYYYHYYLPLKTELNSELTNLINDNFYEEFFLNISGKDTDRFILLIEDIRFTRIHNKLYLDIRYEFEDKYLERDDNLSEYEVLDSDLIRENTIREIINDKDNIYLNRIDGKIKINFEQIKS